MPVLLYTGTGPWQSDRISISGFVFTRGETTEVDETTFGILVKEDGFEAAPVMDEKKLSRRKREVAPEPTTEDKE